MPVDANGSNLLLGRGKVYFDRFTSAGVATGLQFLGEVSSLEVTPSVERRDIFTNTKAASTKLASVPVQQTHALALTMREFNAYNFALALLGSEVVYAQAATPIVAESLTTSVKKGRVYTTAKRKIGSVVVKKLPSTTLVLGTDYEILDTERGLIRVLPTSVTVVDGDSLTVDYTPTAISAGVRVAAGTVGKIEGRLLYVSDNVNGPQMDVEFWKVSLNPSGALALITDDYGELPLGGEVLDNSVNTPTEPLYAIHYR